MKISKHNLKHKTSAELNTRQIYFGATQQVVHVGSLAKKRRVSIANEQSDHFLVAPSQAVSPGKGGAVESISNLYFFQFPH